MAIKASPCDSPALENRIIAKFDCKGTLNARLKLDSPLKRNHPRGAVPAQAHAQQPRRRRNGALQRAELRRHESARHARLHARRQRKVSMIECVEHLHIEAATRMLRQLERARYGRYRSRQSAARAPCCVPRPQTGSSPRCRPPVHAPVVGSTTETNASGFSHCRVPATVTPGYEDLRYSGTPGTLRAYCGPLAWNTPLPSAV